jgi:GAF domain-containing protein
VLAGAAAGLLAGGAGSASAADGTIILGSANSLTGKYSSNAIDDPRLASAASISELKLLSILCVPLVSRRRTLGAIYLDHPQVVGRFNAAHLETVTALAEQAAIQDSLYKLMADKTVIAIAHRLSTIAAMDRLVVMDAGQVVETGSHRELLRQGGIYAGLWRHQSGGFLGDERASGVAAE